MNKQSNAVELIAKYYDLEDKLLQVQEEAKHIGTTETISKDQLEHLRTHERHNHIASMANVQSLAAAREFISRRSKCARPACDTCCYGAAQLKL